MKDIVVSLMEVPPVFSNDNACMWFRALSSLPRQELTRRVNEQMPSEEQKSCAHDSFFIFRRPEPLYLWARTQSLWGTETYVGRLCQCCNRFFLRRTENPWVECHLCGGDMTERDTELGPDRAMRIVYACVRCGHETVQPQALKRRAA